MISRKDILKGKNCPEILENNLSELITKLNKLENLSGIHFSISSGFRDKSDQIRIYNAKGIYDEGDMHMGSKHFTCQAADCCANGLQEWILNNKNVLDDLGLWFEDFKYTPGWTHSQTIRPNSGKRFFIP